MGRAWSSSTRQLLQRGRACWECSPSCAQALCQHVHLMGLSPWRLLPLLTGAWSLAVGRLASCLKWVVFHRALPVSFPDFLWVRAMLSAEQVPPSRCPHTEQAPQRSQRNGKKAYLLACHLTGVGEEGVSGNHHMGQNTQLTAAATLCQVNKQPVKSAVRLPAPGNKERGKAENYKLGRKIKSK